MKIIGHRGARGLAPENTIASFKKALDYKIDLVEFDIRVSKDDVPLLHHDAVLGNLKISNHIYSDLKKRKADLTRLDEALDFINGKVGLYIEVKPRVKVEPIIKALSSYKHSYFLASKNRITLLELHKLAPKVPKIVIETWSGIRAARRAHKVDTKLIAMNQLFLWFGFIKAMKASGFELYAYTINNPVKAKRWAKYGLAGIVTDYPNRFTQ